MSVGTIGEPPGCGAPRSRASTSRHRLTRRRPSTTRSRPARSAVIAHVDEARASRGGCDRGGLAVVHLEHERAARHRARGQPPRTTASTCPSPTSATCGSHSRTSGCERRELRLGRRRAGSRRRGPTARRAARRTGRAGGARRRARCARRSRARARVRLAETSIAVTRAPGCSSAIASAIAPVPVPTSSTRGAVAPGDQAERSARRPSRSRAAGSAPAASTRERQPPEPPLAEDVLERLAPCPPRDERPARVELVFGERPVEVHVELDRAPARAPCASRRSASRRGVSSRFAARCSVDRRRTSPIVIDAGRPLHRRRPSDRGLERTTPLLRLERVGELLEVAVEDLVEPMHGVA